MGEPLSNGRLLANVTLRTSPDVPIKISGEGRIMELKLTTTTGQGVSFLSKGEIRATFSIYNNYYYYPVQGGLLTSPGYCQTQKDILDSLPHLLSQRN